MRRRGDWSGPLITHPSILSLSQLIMLKAPTYFISCLTQYYLDFSGRASREEYWSYVPCWFLIAVPLLSFNLILYLFWETLTFLP